MRFGTTLIPTLKENPVEARVESHRLMLRAGLIRQLGAGIYTWLPLGLRVLRRVEAIVREEMDAAGAQEILMPAVQPAELWQESGRWQMYGPELLRFKDRGGREFCFGPTHEEVVTDLVRRELRSYRDLPANFYQIQTKFRDEIRPRFGIMRGREFLMKDAYSFDLDEEGLEQSYRTMVATYNRIFERCGLRYRAVEADTGAIGGAFSHEFHVLADSGEDVIASCEGCGYAANLEKAEGLATPGTLDVPREVGPLRKVATPGRKTMEEVAEFLGCPLTGMVKSLVVEGTQGAFQLLLRGDHELNLVKAAHALGMDGVALVDPERAAELAGVGVGSMGPVGGRLPVLADSALATLSGFVSGANEEGYHFVDGVWGRDCPMPRFVDLRNVVAGDQCLRCRAAPLRLDRGIEVGHVFKLGDKYTRALKVTVQDADGKERTPIMGCYGIGVSRIVAAAIEQNHDELGIIWPVALAPFAVELLVVNPREEASMQVARSVEQGLRQGGIEVLMDDRDERLGVKFKDADLLGLPWRAVIGGRSLKEGAVEIQRRGQPDKERIALDQVVAVLLARVRSLDGITRVNIHR
ncbi:MAG: proline--tRNA ligase [Magnetococcales bacterium]|nr:proline--tRNA ligase [Magnetococcales bacterium]MBF0151493.1 proline--tRNA ligase [Magnetococcales bacterium]MBF0173710.1 proline--tRNA ligase [Magnetococcales bacterium]MBF0632445.1 proline--tRNA ligase [Magnetococcales bacterium]